MPCTLDSDSDLFSSWLMKPYSDLAVIALLDPKSQTQENGTWAWQIDHSGRIIIRLSRCCCWCCTLSCLVMCEENSFSLGEKNKYSGHCFVNSMIIISHRKLKISKIQTIHAPLK